MKFRLGSIPVRVHAAFLFLALFLVMNQRDPRIIGLWVVIVFVSILVHELGHALVGRAFGLTPQIDLHGMGGTTSWAAGPSLGHGKRIAISLAGPFAGFLLGIVAFVYARQMPPTNRYAEYATSQLFWVNLQWGIFNLLPLLPLDGGNVMKSTLDAMTKGRGEKPARIISILMCAAMLVLAYTKSLWIVGILGVVFGVSNFRGLKDVDRRRADVALAGSIEKAHAALEEERFADAIALVRPVFASEASSELRSMAAQILAYAFLRELRWEELVVLLEREHDLFPEGELARFARAARELGRETEAARIAALDKRSEVGPLGEFKA